MRAFGNLEKPWVQLVLASLLMLATLPGRTQGLGLITEPMLSDLHLDRQAYATLNLWATLLGALACFPAGWAIDRFGIRWVTAAVTLILGAAVWRLSGFAGSASTLFAILLVTRATGQSALSVCSITAVGKWFPSRVSLAMGVYSVLLSVFFAIAFVSIGYSIRQVGWRPTWMQIAWALLGIITPLVLIVMREPGALKPAEARTAPLEETSQTKGGLPSQPGFTLAAALRTGAFWAFAGAAALFNLVSSGLGLFNEAVLAEHGFDQKTFHKFLAATTLLSLVGQFACGWLATRWKFQKLTSLALSLYGLGLAGIPFARTLWELWLVAIPIGFAGGMIIVIFFSIWSAAFGPLQLGRIQGTAQMVTVVASAAGPVLFAGCAEAFHSYTPALISLACLVGILAVVANGIKLPAETGGDNRPEKRG